MHVGVGYSELPGSTAAGTEAAVQALAGQKKHGPCSLVLLFATARHNATHLRSAVAAVVGEGVPIIGGSAVGIITNTQFGYAGEQVGVAAIWLQQEKYQMFVEENLTAGETEAGMRLGRAMLARGITPQTPFFLFYDALVKTDQGLRMIMATSLLAGLEQGLGFFPPLFGAGMQGDFIGTPTQQWTGSGTQQHTALGLAFSPEVQVDFAIMHGCRPGTGYYTVTKAEGQTILEINGQPALPFLRSLLGAAIPQEAYPFFLLFGVGSKGKWQEFAEEHYASRLCLGLDLQRNGIVMFEPDMVAGTEFQIMYRNGEDHGYIPPRIEALFQGVQHRKPVLALYINCAGRAAAYSGLKHEDAEVVQHAVAGRAPLLGLYTGVEIAPMEGRPRGLDWTGVFCLLSVPI
ncbi:FIST signal transduction protein [Desulfovibrio cuneatus]|uniref:FIST signal transduction protein n=1 Tax=Desulfovibrio cuneatus TaxID=159728 RepID=UPI000428EFA8|nr:FIST N-terminal domain-containing protein [Desulfovibrio cuneatus]